MLQYELPYYGPATFVPQHLSGPPSPPLRTVHPSHPLPPKEYEVHPQPHGAYNPKISPTHHGVPPIISGYNSGAGVSLYRQQQQAEGHHDSQQGLRYKHPDNLRPCQFEGDQQHMPAGGLQHQTPRQRQNVMVRMHASNSDSIIGKHYDGQGGYYASTPMQPRYLRWHSADSYYSEGQGGQQMQKHQQIPRNQVQGCGRAELQPQGVYALQSGYGSPTETERSSGRNQDALQGVSPSESLPAKMPMMSIPEQRGSDSSDGGEEEGPGIVTREVQQMAERVVQETSSNREIKTDVHKPFDPNLVCPICNKQFRIGEIQKFKRHVKKCAK